MASLLFFSLSCPVVGGNSLTCEGYDFYLCCRLTHFSGLTNNARKHDKYKYHAAALFCQVALRGSVSRAADDLFRTQSAITRAIRDLEAALNVTLFERHYSGMVPTEYGKCILPRARRAIDDLQAIPALLQKHHTRSSGPLADAGWLFTRRLAILFSSITSTIPKPSRNS